MKSDRFEAQKQAFSPGEEGAILASQALANLVPPGSPFNFLLRWTLDLWVALTRLFYTVKYGTISRRLGLEERSADSSQRGFIVVQIDGLSHRHLQQAMAQGYAPYLEKLLETRQFRLARYRCGLPSTTPAVQAGIMFGDNFDVPAFRWYEKTTDSAMVCKAPRLIEAIQKRLSRRRLGILRGGSSYVNMINGEASLSLFSLGSLSRRRFFAQVRGLGFMTLILLSPWRVLRLIALSLWEYLMEMVDRAMALLSPKPRVPISGIFPFTRVICNVLFRELQTFGAILDLYRGLPAIYTNYNGYDEIAHHFGPDSKPAFRALRGIDKQIKQIDRMRRHSPRRRYDLYVLSDHGQTPSVPFRQLYGRTLGRYITEHDRAGQELDEWSSQEHYSRLRAQHIISELEGFEAHMAKPSAALARSTRRLLEQRIVPDDPPGAPYHARRKVVVMNSGSLANIYFNSSTRQLTWREVEELHPGLLEALLRHEGIGLVVVRADEGIYALSQRGKILLNEGGEGALGSANLSNPSSNPLNFSNPLSQFEEPEVAAAQIGYLASFPRSGDLILFGAYKGGQVVNFEEQVGAHGGLGGPQGYPFILYPRDYSIDTERMINAKELYPHFIKTYQEVG